MPAQIDVAVTFTGSTTTDLPGSTFDAVAAEEATYVVGLILTRGLGLGVGTPEYIVRQGFEG